MVLVIKLVRGKMGQLIFIPRSVIDALVQKHVKRILRGESAQENTCIVGKAHDWTAVPEDSDVIDMLIESFQRARVLRGGVDLRYPMPHHLFHHLMCRQFSTAGQALDKDVCEGDFMVSIRSAPTLAEAKRMLSQPTHEGPLGAAELQKINNTYSKLKDCEKRYLWVVDHVYPKRRR